MRYIVLFAIGILTLSGCATIPPHSAPPQSASQRLDNERRLLDEQPNGVPTDGLWGPLDWQ